MRRETFGGPAVHADKNLGQSQSLGQMVVRPVAPIVEVPSNDERRITGSPFVQPLCQRLHLFFARATQKRQMDADAMNGCAEQGRFNLRVQDAALFKFEMRDILIVCMRNGKSRQDGVAVMAVVIDHVAAIGGRLPDVLGQKFVLRVGGPVLVLFGVDRVEALNFLQKHNVW